jgi:LmbE family N-acetylglucosaminyl deacetylase
MLTVRLEERNQDFLNILCLGAHSDDIEIGCGGSILQLLKNNRNLVFHWVVFSANEKRKKEALASAKAFLKDARSKTVVIKNFRDGYFPFVGAEIKNYFETLKKAFSPDLIFTPCRNDLHQDHRLIAELTWNTFRDHVILEYEIAKYDGDLGSPNMFVHLDEAVCQTKVRNILSTFKTQTGNHWFAEDAFLSLLRIRGIESNSPTRYAEAFYSRKAVLGSLGRGAEDR